MHVDTDSQKLNADQKFYVWEWSKMGVTVCSQESKIDCIKNEQME